jgi:hypothetical protein
MFSLILRCRICISTYRVLAYWRLPNTLLAKYSHKRLLRRPGACRGTTTWGVEMGWLKALFKSCDFPGWLDRNSTALGRQWLQHLTVLQMWVSYRHQRAGQPPRRTDPICILNSRGAAGGQADTAYLGNYGRGCYVKGGLEALGGRDARGTGPSGYKGWRQDNTTRTRHAHSGRGK